MNVIIYIVIAVLFGVLIAWTWNNSKSFQTNNKKITFILVGLAILFIITFIIFSISGIGISYPNNEIMKQVRKIAILIFMPVNGFLSLPHIANIKAEVEKGNYEQEKLKRRIIIFGIVWLILIIFEIIYLKDFQNGIIQISNKNVITSLLLIFGHDLTIYLDFL